MCMILIVSSTQTFGNIFYLTYIYKFILQDRLGKFIDKISVNQFLTYLFKIKFKITLIAFVLSLRLRVFAVKKH